MSKLTLVKGPAEAAAPAPVLPADRGIVDRARDALEKAAVLSPLAIFFAYETKDGVFWATFPEIDTLEKGFAATLADQILSPVEE